jgi:hypothetical protein
MTCIPLYIYTLSSILFFLLKTLFTANSFYPFKWSNQCSNMVGVYGIHLRLHGLKPILKVNIRYCFQVVGRLINYKQLIIFSFNEKSISYWCMKCPTKSIEFLYFLSFRLNIQCYSLNIRFYLNVNFWFLNFFKFHFPFIANFKNKIFL